MKRPGEVRQKYDAHIETSLLASSNPAESEVREQARSLYLDCCLIVGNSPRLIIGGRSGSRARSKALRLQRR